jgi:type 1 fimbria pilin
LFGCFGVCWDSHWLLQGATQVLALPTTHPVQQQLNNCSSSSSNNSNCSVNFSAAAAGTEPLLPRAAWLLVISPDDDLDVLLVDHLGLAAAANGSSSSSTGTSGTSRSASAAAAAAAAGSAAVRQGSRQDRFLAIADDDQSPDGDLLLITASNTDDPHMVRRKKADSPKLYQTERVEG